MTRGTTRRRAGRRAAGAAGHGVVRRASRRAFGDARRSPLRRAWQGGWSRWAARDAPSPEPGRGARTAQRRGTSVRRGAAPNGTARTTAALAAAARVRAALDCTARRPSAPVGCSRSRSPSASGHGRPTSRMSAAHSPPILRLRRVDLRFRTCGTSQRRSRGAITVQRPGDSLGWVHAVVTPRRRPSVASTSRPGRRWAEARDGAGLTRVVAASVRLAGHAVDTLDCRAPRIVRHSLIARGAADSCHGARALV